MSLLFLSLFFLSLPSAHDMDPTPPSGDLHPPEGGQLEAGSVHPDIRRLFLLINYTPLEAVNRFRLFYHGRHNPQQREELLNLAFAYHHFNKDITHPDPACATTVWRSLISLSELYHEIATTESCLEEFPTLFEYALVGINQVFKLASISSYALPYNKMTNDGRG
ncbi:hypothetical protein OF83DRAFT_473136 [Amylostereum chailletii]|nr:hypothetical protein OF83DRAFT_473136 [Amylostereum chailletii]